MIASLSMLSPGGEGGRDKIEINPDYQNSLDVKLSEDEIIKD